MTGRRVLVIGGAVVVFGGVAFGVYRLLTRDPAYVDERAATTLLEQTRTEAPLTDDLDLPVARHAETIRKPHARLELGKHDLRLFGRVVSPMPSPSATTFPSSELTSIATWGIGVFQDAGVESRTLEVAADRDVRFGLVREAYAFLSEGGFSADLFLVKDPSGALRVLHPVPIFANHHVRVDAKGARLERGEPDAGVPDCHWAVGTDTSAFASCIEGPPPAEPDAGADAATMDLRMLAQMLGQRPDAVEIRCSLDARYGDVIAIADAVTSAGMSFFFSVDAPSHR